MQVYTAVSTILLISLCFALRSEQQSSSVAADEMSSHPEDVHGDAGSHDQSVSNEAVMRMPDGTTRTARHYVLSMATGKFMAITMSGRVAAKARIGKSILCFQFPNNY